MEEDQEMIKHICKLCDKSFPCGRSLGGHMRSHVINSSTADQTDEKNLTRKKLSNLTNGLIESNEDNGYVLRENPKKTCRFADLNEDSLLHHKFCKQCGKGFCSWKALFGHMKCHSEKFSNSLEEDSWTSANQSDTETAAAAAPNRKKRSRRVTRYISTTTTTNSSFSVANNNNNNNNGSSSASEIDHQEQEEVALCLIMLSKDVGSKNNCLNSVDESSDNNFELLEAGSSIRSNRVTKNEGKNSWSNGGEAVKKFRKLRNGKLESAAYDSNSNGQFDLKQSEYGASQDSKLNKSEFHNHGFLGHDKSKKCKVEDGSILKVSEVGTGKDLVNENGGMDQAEFSSKKPNLNPKKLRNGKLTKSDFRDKGFLGNGKSKKSKVDDESRFEAPEVELSKNLGKENGLEDQAEFSSKKHKLNSKKPRTEKLLESTILESNSQFDSVSGISRNESKPNKSGSRGDGVLGDYKSKKPKVDDESRFGPSELTPGEDLIKENGGQDQAEFSSRKHNVSKKKYRDLLNNQELGSESWSKFECTTCNKAFHSYQALGGHRASHKKTKGCCFSSKIDESENSIETENISLIKNEELIEQKGEKSCVVASKNNNKKGAHECPICFRVFSSGQALGGHKRSHLIAEAKSSNQTVAIQKPIPEIRDLLDLNLPAPVEEESSGNVGFNPWWVGTNSNPEPLIGFLSN